MNKVEEKIKGFGGLSIYTQRHIVDDAKANLVIVHGYCEHSDRYQHLVEYFNGKGMNVFLLDLRGHGKSEGQRAHVMQFEEYHDDLDRFVAQVMEWSPDLPSFLLGHSLGGLIVFSYLALRPNSPFKGGILSSPYFGLAIDVAPVKKIAAKLLTKFLPHLSLKSEIDPYLLTHDKKVVEDYINDPNVPKVANTRWFTESAKMQETCMRKAPEVQLPFLLMHGGEDQIAGPDITRKIYALLGSKDKQLQILDGLYHEIFNEIEKQDVMDKTWDWISPRI